VRGITLKGSFYKLLKERGRKWTRQRDEIAKEFLKAGRQAGRHLSVLELYQRVRDRNPRIGYTTVYRTLKLMEKNGWASSRKFGERWTRFELQAGGEHHDHLICLGCGKIVEFESERIEAIQARIARQQGFRIFNHKLELYGHCPTCAKARILLAGAKQSD
jgi:Fur family transcriptional regulator, ferric uptake regulator